MHFVVRWVMMLMSVASAEGFRVATTTDTQDAAAKLLKAIDGLHGSDVLQEKIHSFYWWEGKVASEEEVRLSFNTTRPLDEVLSAVGSVHNYDVPMIIGDTIVGDRHWHWWEYWKGLYAPVEPEMAMKLAEELAASRLVACAQVASDGSVAVKTSAKAKAALEALAVKGA